MLKFSKYFMTEQIADIASTSKDIAIAGVWKTVSGNPAVAEPERFLDAIMARELIMSTGIGSGIAIPHAKTSAVTDFVIAVGRIREGMDFESLDGLPVQIIILMGAPERKRTDFLSLIARIGSVFNTPGFKEDFLDADSPEAMKALLVSHIDRDIRK
jgi:mannitol/fructose-specific phosphotransferase system IIA component (Ntr-type)